MLAQQFLVLLAALLLLTTTAQAENWPQFRGPTRQGLSTETNLPITWSTTSNILWKTAIPGESWSSPITWNDRVFVTTATDNGQSCRVLSLNASSGAILWDREAFQQVPRRKEERNTYSTPTPATDGERVYACFGDGSFVAFNFAGDILWTNRNYPFYSQHGLGSSPILYKDLLIMARDGSSDGEDKKLGWQTPWDKSYVIALDTKTGVERWKAKRGLSRISHGVPNIWEQNGKAQVISEAGDVVQGFDAASGERIWSSEVIGEGKVPSMVLGEGLAFTSGGWGGKETIKAFRLGATGDLKESNLVWEQRKGMPKLPSMIYLKPNLYAIGGGGVVTCMKADTGELVYQERVGGNFSASPISADGLIYLLSDEGVTTVIKAGEEFKILATNTLPEKAQASMAVSNHHLLIRTIGQLYCIGKN